MSEPPPFSLPCPPSPVMLYIGAGYDLSPLLLFAPGGPPYPIVPLSGQDDPHAKAPFPFPDEYTSFLFVDAKPRFTSAYMVSDFHEWTSEESRVRNVLHYAQGTLSRWRSVPGAPDLLWFEGGGDPSLVDSRSRDPAWVFPDQVLPNASSSKWTLSSRPLTTLLYLFNTLDLELVRAPLLDLVWPRVEALYVHGLRLHVHTGAGLSLGGHPMSNVMGNGTDIPDLPSSVPKHTLVPLNGGSLQSQLGTGLKRCYVIVGSWGIPLHKPRITGYKDSTQETDDDGTPILSMGIRHVDFVSGAWRRWKAEVRTSAEVIGSSQHSKDASFRALLSNSPSSISSSPSFPSTPFSVSPITSSVAINTTLHLQTHVPSAPPLILRRPRVQRSISMHQGWHSDGLWDSDYDGDSEDLYTDPNERGDEESHEQGHVHGAALAESNSSRRISDPFHVRIPQLAWSSTLRSGRGGYFIEKTVEESLALWRARKGRRAGESEVDETASEGEFNFKEKGKKGENFQKGVQYRLRSFFSIGAHTPSPSSERVQPVSHPSIIPRSRKPPPRSRPRLRPRPPTPAPDSDESGSENSASETVFGVNHCGGAWSGGLCECECRRMGDSRATYQMDARSEKEGVAFGFWRRKPRERRALKDFNARVGACETRGMTMQRPNARSTPQIDRDVPSFPAPAAVPVRERKPARTTIDTAVRHWRNPSSKSLDAPSNVSRPRSGFSPQRESRIDITDFLNTTSDPNACDTLGGLSSIDPVTPTSISEPVRCSSDTACDGSHSYTSPSLPTFPRSPYCSSDLSDSDNVKENPRVPSSIKWRPLMLQFWAKKKRRHEERCHAGPNISRAGSISGLFAWKKPMAREQCNSPPSGLPLSPASAHKSPGCPHKDACVCAHSHARTHTSRWFRFDPDAPPVPPLPSHFLGYAHTRSMFDPMTLDTSSPYSSTRTQPEATSTSENPSSIHSLDRPVGISTRQSDDSDQTHVGVWTSQTCP